MAKELFISTTPHETKVAVVDDEQLSEIYFERENEYTLAGSIYKGRVTRVLPGMQSAFVDIGLERDAFLYVTDFLEEQEDQEDFEQVADRSESQRSSQTASLAAQEQQTAGAEDGSAQEQQSSDQFERGPRRWRGRRGRRRGRGGFPEQGAQQTAPDTAESFEGEQASEGGEQEAIILPGESLSKYRHADVEGEAPTPPETVPETQRTEPPQPSAHVASQSHAPEPAPGGPISMLPGESISKYRGGETGQTPAEPQSEKQPSRFERFRKRFESRRERPNRRQENESPRQESASAGPPVFALPGESLAKYRGRGSSSLESSTAQPRHALRSEYVAQP
ncbi:MAG TPA: hypothetical protein VJU82_08195, partial [Acidobacteriaceae bacterium]|nr:hypothetical protein [Acidobacteriaceae bacterium]